MAFGLFKKKDDDLSDFGSEKGSSDKMTDPPHMGLPLDGDITNTSQVPKSSDPFGQSPSDSASSIESVHSPSSFQDLNDFNSQQHMKEATSFQQPQPSHSPAPQGALPAGKMISLEKDVQLLNAKMDAVKAVLESINHRLAHIERIAEDEHKKEETVRW